MRYLLDTNIVSDLIRNPNGRVAAQVGIVGEASACTSVVVAAELWYGALKRQSARLTAQIELILSTLEIIPFDVPAERVYG